MAGEQVGKGEGREASCVPSTHHFSYYSIRCAPMKETKGERRRQRSHHAHAHRASPLFFNLPFLPLKSWSRRGDSHSRGASARQFTKLLLSLLSHAGERMAEEKV